MEPKDTARVDILGRIENTWPQAALEDVMWVGPIGSRFDLLLYWRTSRRVATGRRGTAPCFEGDIDEFAKKVDEDYRRRLLPEPYLDPALRSLTQRSWSDYRAAASFLGSLSTERLIHGMPELG